MNKYLTSVITAFIPIIFFTTCKNEKDRETEKLQDNLRTYFIENFKDSTSSLDSFRLAKIDTITERMLLFEQISVLNSQLESLMDICKLNTESLSNSIDKMKLYRMIESPELIEIEKNNAHKKLAKGDKMRAEIDTLASVIETIKNKVKIADTIKPIGYQAKCFYQERFKDKSVKTRHYFYFIKQKQRHCQVERFCKLTIHCLP